MSAEKSIIDEGVEKCRGGLRSNSAKKIKPRAEARGHTNLSSYKIILSLPHKIVKGTSEASLS